MSKRWANWVQQAYPLSDKDKANMIGECDAEYAYINAGIDSFKKLASPAQQFDESHKKWVENGREC